MQDIRIERIIILGIPKNFVGKTVKVTQSEKEWDTTVTMSSKTKTIVIRDPKVLVGEDWEIHF